MIAELRTFVAIARLGTFALAADKVGLTPAAVSGQIKRLEEHLGFSLFDRTGRSATLNANGARTLPRAQAILGLFDVLGEPDTDGATASLKIGAVAPVQSSLLARALVLFLERYPKCNVHVVPGLSLHLIDQMDSGDLDLAIVVRPHFDLPPELVWHTLRREPYVLIAPADCPGDDWRELIQTRPFLRYHRLSLGGRQVERFLRNLPLTVTPTMEISLQAMLTMVQNGRGVALVPVSESQFPLPANVRALPLGDAGLFREIGYIRSRVVEPEPTARYLAECLELAAEAPASARPTGD